jgi:hypothetical protein
LGQRKYGVFGRPAAESLSRGTARESAAHSDFLLSDPFSELQLKNSSEICDWRRITLVRISASGISA